jgi:pimeloyl-ACP methyl ester carboxylesterase
MNQNRHHTAPTQFVEANGIRFAYRRFGKAGGVPIIFNQHYTGTMDYWDPAVTDGLARDREVILFNNAGVSSSSGEVPTTFEQMGANWARWELFRSCEDCGQARRRVRRGRGAR